MAGLAGALLGTKTKAIAKTIEEATNLNVVLIQLDSLYVDISSIFHGASGIFQTQIVRQNISCKGYFTASGPENVDKIMRAFEDNILVDFVFDDKESKNVLKGKCYITSIEVLAPVDDEVRLSGVVSSYGVVTATTKTGLITDFPLLLRWI